MKMPVNFETRDRLVLKLAVIETVIGDLQEVSAICSGRGTLEMIVSHRIDAPFRQFVIDTIRDAREIIETDVIPF